MLKIRNFEKDQSFYNVSGLGENYRSVNQIDLVPTISLLLGLPIPYNNLGFPIDEAFGNVDELSVASQKTINQIKAFRDDTPNLSGSLIEQYQSYATNYSNFGGNPRSIIGN